MATENEAFPRWQKIAIEQLGYVVNLILTFTIAALGYWFVILHDAAFKPSPSAQWAMVASLGLLASSAFCGFGCVVIRLSNFRGTASRARGIDPPPKHVLDGLGRLTWGLFYAQLVTFPFGILALAIALLITDGWKLW
jgi:hypothetical protein